MNARRIFVAAAAMALFLMAACHIGPLGPKATAEKFYQKLIDQKYDDAAHMLAVDKDQQNDGTYKKLSGFLQSAMSEAAAKQHRKPVKAKAVSERIYGDQQDMAEVKMQVTYSDGKVEEETGKLKKVDGKWMVYFGK